ncbi:chorismate-binding protein [Burkholderia cenocepacia]|uniref:chorismate-binding protein n=1 Tax=Burkholderia cenocepacia TaxID=95486 RepID=UPI001B9CC89A|nr:chorismate-binding protein [Burkholderia cenocepacia]MBR8030151.1 chorismate-binding protein [Burkholderia cenocepacia]MBR8174029.1 chorismate-binding protein [Burkholderia cenocepacia]
MSRETETTRVREFSFSGDVVDRVLGSIDPTDDVFVLERWDPNSLRADISYVGFSNELEIIQSSRRNPGDDASEFRRLEEILAAARGTSGGALHGLSGGVLAFYSYESLTDSDALATGPRAMFMQPRGMLIFDHQQSKGYAIVPVGDSDGGQGDVDLLDRLESLCNGSEQIPIMEHRAEPKWTYHTAEGEFVEFASKAIERSRLDPELDGTVLSVLGSTQSDIPTISSYRWLRRINPSTYMFLAQSSQFAVWGATSLTLARLKGNTLTVETDGATRPVESQADGSRFVWVPSEKEIDEYDVVLDALVDDLKPIVKPESVHFVAELQERRFFDLLHLFAEMEAEKREDVSALDVVRRLSPHGAAVGYTRKRATETIAELEPVSRGPFSGTIGFFGFDGSLESAAVTRSMWKTPDGTFIHAGAKVVAASDPASEYRECVLKTKALRDCARLAVLGESGPR